MSDELRPPRSDDPAVRDRAGARAPAVRDPAGGRDDAVAGDALADDPFADLDPHGGPLDPLARPGPPAGPVERVMALADATGVSAGRLLGGVLAMAVLAVAAAWALRPPPPPPELDLPYIATTEVASPAGSVPETAATAGAADADELDEVVVHVAGAVADPGVHRLAPGGRVVDAVAVAGGLTAEADEARVNLAAPVVDGERVYVPRHGEDDPPAPVAGSAPADAGSGAGTAGPVDLNRASQAELEALPGVGPATAAAIVEHRARIGAFTSVDQLLDVRGIGPAKLEQLRPHARV